MIVQFELRRATAAEWASDNPVLAAGEPGIDTTNNTLKVGDGVTHWATLDIISGGGGGGGDTAWASITGKPTVFPPVAHQHSTSDIAGYTESVQDLVASLITAGAGIDVTYDDAAGSLVIASTVTGGGGGGGATDAEAVRDIIGSALLGQGLISVSPNDPGDTISIATSATQNATDAALRDRGTHTGIEPLSAAPAGSLLVAPLNGSTNTSPTMARPSARTDIFFVWRSTVQPLNMIAGDDWFIPS